MLIESITATKGLQEMTLYVIAYGIPTVQIAVFILYSVILIFLAKYRAPKLLIGAYLVVVGMTISYIAIVKAITLSILAVFLGITALTFVYLWRSG